MVMGLLHGGFQELTEAVLVDAGDDIEVAGLEAEIKFFEAATRA